MGEEKVKMPGLKGKKKTLKKDDRAISIDEGQITEERDIWSMRKGSQEDLKTNNLSSMLATTLSANDEFNEWLLEAESYLDDDVISFKIFDLQAIMDKRKKLEELYDQIENHNIVELSENFQRFCQMIPPSKDRIEKKVMIRDTRSRVMKLRLKVVEQREILRLVVPMLCRYNEYSLKIKPWLDDADMKSQPFIDSYNNDNVLLEHADVIQALLEDLLEQKPTYEAFLTYGETAIDFSMKPFEDLQSDIDQTAERWDNLCTKLEKCLTRLDIAKKLEEQSQKNESERIDRQIRREAHSCNCHIPFQIVRIGEGKYTFGTSKLVRLVRIHGSSVVVRVGGGWEFLYEFLMRCDPCRAKEYLEDGAETLKKMGIKPIDERRHSYAFESRRVFSHSLLNSSSSSHRDIKHACETEHGSEANSLSSSIDSLDGGSLGSDAGHTCNEKTPRTTRTPKGLLRRKTSGSNISTAPAMSKGPPAANMRPKSSTPTCAGRPARRSLVERQGDFSEKMKSSSLPRKLVDSGNFV